MRVVVELDAAEARAFRAAWEEWRALNPLVAAVAGKRAQVRFARACLLVGAATVVQGARRAAELAPAPDAGPAPLNGEG